jgi:PIN domain nuclease of toxin-antitoxin system
VRLLLDSNVLYWSFTQNRLLTPRVFGLLSDRSNELFVSSVSLWELSIKVAKGKLVVPNGTILSFYEQIDRVEIATIPVTKAHILRTETLPHHHRDPFDRMIVAQALEENLTILTADSDIPGYAAPVVWK